MFSGKGPTVPWARVSVCMDRPQLGQKAAVSGIWAAQCGHEISVTLDGSTVGHDIKTPGGRQMGASAADVQLHRFTCRLTPSRTDSMFRAIFCAAEKMRRTPGG